MDNLRIINPRSVDRTPPPEWNRGWCGYFEMKKVRSQVKHDRDKKTHKAESGPQLKGEGFIEQQFFLNMMTKLKGHVNLIELGAGRGDWCLALAGIVDFDVIDHEVTSYKCLAVEGEPTHYEWTKTHFEEQQINAIPVNGAVSSYNGECKFYTVEDPASGYGQSINDNGNITVPCFTLDHLVEKYQFDKIDILHSDIQGAEFGMLKGALKTLVSKKIQYMLIGMHIPGQNKEMIEFLEPYGYKTLFSVEVHSGECDTPFGKAIFPVDGLLVLERV